MPSLHRIERAFIGTFERSHDRLSAHSGGVNSFSDSMQFLRKYQRLAWRQDHGPLDDVLQFSDVSRPRVICEPAHRFVVYRFYLFTEFFRELLYEELRKQRNIACAFAQARYTQGNNV